MERVRRSDKEHGEWVDLVGEQGIDRNRIVPVDVFADGADFNAPTLIPGSGWTIGVVVNLLGTTNLAAGLGLELHNADYSLIAEESTTLSYCFIDL